MAAMPIRLIRIQCKKKPELTFLVMYYCIWSSRKWEIALFWMWH